MARVVAGPGIVTVGGTDCEVRSWDGKLTMAEIDITSTASGGWGELLAGGKRSFEGSIEFDYDDEISGSGDYPVPFTGASAAFVLNIGDSGDSISFTGIIHEYSLKNDANAGTQVTVSATFKSSGVVTYNAS